MRKEYLQTGFAAAIAAAGCPALAGSIVPALDDADAFYDVTTPSVFDSDNDLPSLPDTTAGLTLAVSATPDATDVASATPQMLVATGGRATGAGLYIKDGQVWAVATNGDRNGFPSGATDTTGTAIGVALGAVADGVAFEAWASFDQSTGTLFTSFNGAEASYALDASVFGTAWNWDGNANNANIGLVSSNSAFHGGLGDGTAAVTAGWSSGSASNLSGTLNRGQTFDTAVPEPGSLALLALGGLAMARRRRK